ncbi:MAG: YkgJ family cysteine cluster protein [Polyangiaceae bacterium]|nr:YkgJ family cysteine cluster protein [Polyangiaceae bacterium]
MDNAQSGQTSQPDAVPRLTRATAPPDDMENALRFLHLMDAQTKVRLAEVAATVNAVVETLVATGQLPLETFEKRRHLTVLRENERAQGEASIAISNVDDKYSLTNLPDIDCASLLHLCKARCCKLQFALSIQDLDERIVKWNYGVPYKIAQRQDGYCVHHERGGCNVYTNRPAVCRTYDCRKDKRIWADFENRIAAE